MTKPVQMQQYYVGVTGPFMEETLVEAKVAVGRYMLASDVKAAILQVRENLEALAAKWRAQCKVLETGQPTFGDGLAASREECARNLDFLAASLAKDAPVSFGSPKCPKCTRNMWEHPNLECSGDITS